MKRWTRIFKALANENRLMIIKFLSPGKPKTVTEISNHLKISLKATSRHLMLLERIEIVEGTGSQGHVFYTLNKKIPNDILNVLKLFS